MQPPSSALRLQVLWPDDGGYSQVIQVSVPDPAYYPDLDLILACEVVHFATEWIVRMPDGSRVGAKRLLTLWREIKRLDGILVRLD